MAKGQQPHEATPERRRQVLTMVGMGLTQTEILRLIEIDRKTLYKYYRHELDTGVAEANLRVAKSLFDMATKEKVHPAAIFWMRARAGWRDRDAADMRVAANATVIIGGIDKPPEITETYEEWLIRRRTELDELERAAIGTESSGSQEIALVIESAGNTARAAKTASAVRPERAVKTESTIDAERKSNGEHKEPKFR
jgi:hypothetical protein